jgi:type I restriction enzyme, S subunit
MHEWRTIPLAECAAPEANSFVDGPFGSDLKVSDYAESGVRILQLQNIGDGYFIDDNLKFTSERKATLLSRCNVRPGDLVIAKMAEPLARAAVVPAHVERAVIVADLIKLRSSQDVDRDFLCAAINGSGFRREAERLSTGTTRTRISLSTLRQIPLLHPPKGEQTRLGDIVRTIDEAISETEALIAKTQQIKAGLMHDLFTRGVTSHGQLRPPREEAPNLYKESSLGWIPKEWETRTTVACATNAPGSTTIGPFGSSLVASDYRSEGVPIVFVRDVKEDGFKWNSNVYVSHEKAISLAAHAVRPGDIIATKMGLPPCVACSYPSWMTPGVVTADIIRLRPDLSVVDVRWLSAALNGDAVKRQVQAITAGVTRPKVTLADFRKLRVACPPKTEQVTMGDRIETVETLLADEFARLGKLSNLKHGLMHDLLTGRVRVPVAEAQEVAASA